MQLTDLSRPSSGDRHRPRKSRAKAGAKRGRPKGGKNLLTLEREFQARVNAMAAGEELAKTWLTETMQVAGRMMRRYCPVTEKGEESQNKHADVEKFYRACNLLTQCAVPLLPFQSPKLAAVAIQTGPQIETDKEHTVLTVNIFEGGKQVGRFIDGEAVPLDDIAGDP